MGSLESLILHMERLDQQLPTREIYLHQDHLKVVKEILLTKREIKRRLCDSTHSAVDPAFSGRLNRITSGRGYNIDRVNELYRDAVVCPNCCATDVAVIKYGTPSPHELDYSQHRNPRVKLMNRHCPPPAAGKFSCNGCFSRFEPPLPPHTVKLCEMLFKYYY